MGVAEKRCTLEYYDGQQRSDLISRQSTIQGLSHIHFQQAVGPFTAPVAAAFWSHGPPGSAGTAGGGRTCTCRGGRSHPKATPHRRTHIPPRPATAMVFGLARLTAQQIEKASPFYILADRRVEREVWLLEGMQLAALREAGRQMIRIEALYRVVHPRELPQEVETLAAVVAVYKKIPLTTTTARPYR